MDRSEGEACIGSIKMLNCCNNVTGGVALYFSALCAGWSSPLIQDQMPIVKTSSPALLLPRRESGRYVLGAQ